MITNPIAIHEFFIALAMATVLAIIAAIALSWFLSCSEKEEEIPDAKPPTHTDDH